MHSSNQKSWSSCRCQAKRALNQESEEQDFNLSENSEQHQKSKEKKHLDQKNSLKEKNEKHEQKRKRLEREEVLREAIEEVSRNKREKGSELYSHVARKFNIPVTTLHDRVNKVQIRHGAVLTASKEETLIKYIKEQQAGSPFTKDSLIDMVNEYLKVMDFIH